MPYWSKGTCGIRRGDYTGPQTLYLDDRRPMYRNLQAANWAVSRFHRCLPGVLAYLRLCLSFCGLGVCCCAKVARLCSIPGEGPTSVPFREALREQL